METEESSDLPPQLVQIRQISRAYDLNTLFHLDLSGAGIQKLHPSFHQWLPNLISLDLSNNQLECTIGLGTSTTHLEFLDRLDLHHNQLRSIDELEFCPSITICYLHQNYIQHYQQLEPLKKCNKLGQLTLTENPLVEREDYDYGIVLNMFPYLKKLDGKSRLLLEWLETKPEKQDGQWMETQLQKINECIHHINNKWTSMKQKQNQ